MSESQFDVEVNGSAVRVREQGAGDSLVLLYGYGGVPASSAFADELAKVRRVLTIALPGQQGSNRGHEKLHSPLDWITATLDAIEAAVGPSAPVDLVAQSVSGMIAGEIAAIAPFWLRSVTLIGSLGLFDDDAPTRNLFAESPPKRVPYMTRRPELFKATYGASAEATEAERHEHEVIAYRADEATARLMWPFGDVGLRRRLHRVKAPMLLIWGSEDELVPASYAERFAAVLPSPARIEKIEGAGHLVALEAPEDCARLVLDFTTQAAVAI
jgi:pimeloyl-ACP methyl ester carboxylesterase